MLERRDEFANPLAFRDRSVDEHVRPGPELQARAGRRRINGARIGECIG